MLKSIRGFTRRMTSAIRKRFITACRVSGSLKNGREYFRYNARDINTNNVLVLMQKLFVLLISSVVIDKVKRACLRCKIPLHAKYVCIKNYVCIRNSSGISFQLFSNAIQTRQLLRSNHNSDRIRCKEKYLFISDETQ